jgi:hypothetical protein
MKLASTLGFLLLFLLGFNTAIQAQSATCEYTLEMFDSFGDGWNNATLLVNIGGTITPYTVTETDNDGFSRTVILTVTNGAPISFLYTPGIFETEVTYQLRDSDGNIIFSDGPTPDIGLVFTTTAVCPTCPALSAAAVGNLDIRAFTARVGWVPSDTLGVYRIEYDTTGFTLGTGNVALALGRMANLTGLRENTDYQYYITVLCANGDTSTTVGPFTFKTLWANNVGVTELISPISGCALSATEEMRVRIRNFGGSPQSLIPIRFSVNGEAASVNIPLDGFYTGVLGKDSTDTFLYDLTWDFSEPGEYTIRIWTDLPADSLRSNDTLTVVINSLPVIDNLPYLEDFETWNGGWRPSTAGVNSSWEFGTPSAPMLNAAASGQNAWVTNLEGLYNNSETSYLESPCIDFSGLTEDPRLVFSLWFDSEACCDEAWVELSLNGGQTWAKLGASGTGLNWYNDNVNQWWDGDGGFTGWVTAFNTLTGTAGQSDVRIRFAFSSDGSVPREGMGIDNIFIAQPLAVDLFNQGATYTAAAACGSETGTVRINIVNLGTTAQTGFNVAYSINGGAPVVENVGALNIPANQQAAYIFTTPLEFTQNGTYNIRLWTELAGDLQLSNDTSSLVVNVELVPVIIGLPYFTNYETGNDGWRVGTGSNTPSWQFGQPAGAMLNAAASGQNAWVTNLAGEYNNNELSYLVSPCYDFSDVTENPRLSFSLWFDSEACCDEAWVERSIDGGQTWAKVGTSGTGLNWYNDAGSQWWDGDGGFTGWVTAFNTLTGVTGQPNVRIRFVFSTDGSVVREGMGVDDVRITIPAAADVSNSATAYTVASSCGIENGTLRITIVNFGTQAQTGFNVAYSVNGGTPVVENVGALNIPANQQAAYTFTTPLEFTQNGSYNITAWTELAGDLILSNDTTGITVNVELVPIIPDFPYSNDFESGSSGWKVGVGSSLPSWQFGQPAGVLLNEAASGLNAWVTNLSGAYNNNELSYLVSPCFDFSSMTEDPRLAFSLWFESENNSDRAWVERSIDGGQTWTKVGTSGTGQNWYNNAANQYWTGTGGFSGWVTASNLLSGTAGQSLVNVRFVFASNAFNVFEGMGIDDVSVSAPLANDLATQNSSFEVESICGPTTGVMRFTISNLSNQAQTGFNVAYSVNGGTPVVENVGALNIPANQQASYTFTTPLEFTQSGNYNITAWTELAGDLALSNDTTSITLNIELVPVIPDFPYTNGFENGSGGWSVGAGSNSPSWQFGQPAGVLLNEAANGLNAWVTNLAGDYNNNELSYLVSPCFDFSDVSMDPFLSFSLWFDSEACCDEAWVERSIDGGQTWTKVGTSGTGQNWYNDGGTQWWDGTGGFTGWVTAYNTLTGVAGQSSVRVRFVFSTDGSVVREGMGVDDINIDATPTGIAEPIERLTGISLAPNPTGGISTLSVSFAEPVDAVISIHDMLGRPVSVIKDYRVSNGVYPIDLSNHPAGIYLIRVMVEGKVNTLKLVRGQ